MDDLMNTTELQKVLQEYGEYARNIYQDKLILADKIASGDLLNSCEVEVKVRENSYLVTLTLANYWKYVEGGSKGLKTSPPGAVGKAHFPPPNVLEQWIQVKPVLPTPDKNGRIPTPKSLAFLIGRKIQQHGIDPVPALAEAKEEASRVFYDRIAQALRNDIAAYMEQVFASTM